MASMISLECRTQQSYNSIIIKDFAVRRLPDGEDIFPIIAKGNIIEGIEAKE